MDFQYSAKVHVLQRRVEDFMDRYVLPAVPRWPPGARIRR